MLYQLVMHFLLGWAFLKWDFDLDFHHQVCLVLPLFAHLLLLAFDLLNPCALHHQVCLVLLLLDHVLFLAFVLLNQNVFHYL